MFEKRQNLYDCSTCLFRYITCQYVEEDEFETIRSASIPIHFKKGEIIFKRGTKSTHLVFLHKGIVKFIHEDESEKPFITAIVKGTKLLGAANMFFHETNVFSVVAVEDCDICLIDNRLLRNVAIEAWQFGTRHGRADC